MPDHKILTRALLASKAKSAVLNKMENSLSTFPVVQNSQPSPG